MKLSVRGLAYFGKVFLPFFICFAPLQVQAQAATKAVSFASDGHLKMLYDNRMHPAAIEYEGKVYIAWRGVNGWPQTLAYDLESREFSPQVNILDGLEDVFDLEKYTSDALQSGHLDGQ